MRKLFQVFVILTLAIATLVLTINSGSAQQVEGQKIRLPSSQIISPQPPTVSDSSPALSSACALKPVSKANKSKGAVAAVPDSIPLSRFRQGSEIAEPEKATPDKAPSYTPTEDVALAHPTNFGRRFVQDLYGKTVDNAPIVVLHETVGSAQSTLNLFQTPHPNDDDQVSYHTLIDLDGTIIYLVPPDRRAFGAGNSIFASDIGQEAVQTNPDFPPSVNNFAYHISLVTPSDGRNNADRHSGYTRSQYQSLAWLVAKTGVPNSRITSHRTVDRSRQRRDPRSFDSSYFLRLLSVYPKTQEISTQCSTPAVLDD